VESLIHLAIVVLILVLTYVLMSEGLWGAALMCFNILFASLIAFNFYEALASLIAQNAGSWSHPWADMVSLMGLFLVSVTLLRLTTDSLGSIMVRFPTPLYHLGRITFGLIGATITTAVLLLALNCAPVHKKLFGVLGYDAKPPFGMAIDRRFLAGFQYATGYTFSRGGNAIEDPEFGDAHVFDPAGRWLIDHEQARPFGEGTLDEVATSGDAAASDSGGASAGGGNPGASS